MRGALAVIGFAGNGGIKTVIAFVDRVSVIAYISVIAYGDKQMVLLIERPPTLPPTFDPGPRRDRDEPVIMPDIRYMGSRQKTQHENCWTIHHFHMNRVWGFYDRFEYATVDSRRYRQWLETYPMPDGIPPHIQFGGAVVAGERDPEFLNRWKVYARKTFC